MVAWVELNAMARAKLQCHIDWIKNMSSGGNCLHVWLAVYESVTFCWALYIASGSEQI